MIFYCNKIDNKIDNTLLSENIKSNNLINFGEEEDFNYLSEQENDKNKISNYNKVAIECQQWRSNFQFLRFILYDVKII